MPGDEPTVYVRKEANSLTAAEIDAYRLELYLDLPDGVEPDPKGSHFVGNLALFVGSHHHGEESTTYDITDEVRTLHERGLWTNTLRVKFVRGTRAKRGIPRSSLASVRFRSRSSRSGMVPAALPARRRQGQPFRGHARWPLSGSCREPARWLVLRQVFQMPASEKT